MMLFFFAANLLLVDQTPIEWSSEHVHTVPPVPPPSLCTREKKPPIDAEKCKKKFLVVVSGISRRAMASCIVYAVNHGGDAVLVRVVERAHQRKVVDVPHAHAAIAAAAPDERVNLNQHVVISSD